MPVRVSWDGALKSGILGVWCCVQGLGHCFLVIGQVDGVGVGVGVQLFMNGVYDLWIPRCETVRLACSRLIMVPDVLVGQG